MGAQNIGILNGGLAAYSKAGLPVHTEADAMPSPTPGTFVATLDVSQIRSVQDVVANLQSKSAVVVDARSQGRFDGTAPEPRPQLLGGHMPGAVNLPFDRLTDPATGLVRTVPELQKMYAELGLLDGRPIIASCGSGTPR
jgi:thiosulfate/3-mercaptopyruvate sulfurtransferase